MYYKKIPHYILAASVLVAIQVLAAPIDAAPTPVQSSTPADATKQLQENQAQLKEALIQVQQHSDQLQAGLLRLTQQIQQAQTVQPQTDKETLSLVELNQQQKQFQDALSKLRTQEQDLAQNMEVSQKRLDDISALSKSVSEVPAEKPAIKPEPELTLTPPVASEITNAEPVVQSAAPKEENKAAAVSMPELTKPAAVETPPAVDIPANIKTSVLQSQSLKTDDQAPVSSSPALLDRAEDPMNMLRIGGGLVALALFLLGWMFWPKKRLKEAEQAEILAEPTELNTEYHEVSPSTLEIEKPVSTSNYDFLETHDAPQNKLDLAAGYVEMRQYEEAKALLQPLLQAGSEAEKEAATDLLEKIPK